MGVYFKGMEMPENCMSCDVERNFHYYCPVLGRDTINVRYSKRLDDCPIVEVKEPHGKLIDVDELIEDLKHDVAIDQDILDYEELTEINRSLTQTDKDVKQNAIDLLEHTRCIIEAEGAES